MAMKSVKITDEKWNSITDIIIAKYPREQFGKITMIVDIALEEYIKRESCPVGVEDHD